MKMMHGEFFLACSNMSRTRLAPTPTNISTNSEPELLKKGTPASPATALASSVLPVPGEPTMSTPLGMRAPSAANFCGSRRNSTTSASSSLASSEPATSAKVTVGRSALSSLRARLRPNCMARFCPPPPAWRMMKMKKPKIRIMGSSMISQLKIAPLLGALSTTMGRSSSFCSLTPRRLQRLQQAGAVFLASAQRSRRPSSSTVMSRPER